MIARRVWRAVFLITATAMAACSSPTEPSPAADFIIDVAGERFVLRLTDPQAIQMAEDNRLGRNQRFPLGPLRQGDGGFNAPWTWHMDPATTQFVPAAIEVCDGLPSYVEQNQIKYPTYCPWSARVVGRK